MTTVIILGSALLILVAYYAPLGTPDHGFRLHYRRGIKYQLTRDYYAPTSVTPDFVIMTPWVELDPSGWILIRSGYGWDGPSGPTLDTYDFMRAALVHDALYQLIRMELLPASARFAADADLRITTKADRMNPVRRWVVHTGLRWFADYAADPKNRRKEFSAPT